MTSHLKFRTKRTTGSFQAVYKNGGGNYSPEGLPVASIGVNNRTNVKDVVELILHAAGGSQIQILRTVAHGNSGVYFFPGLWNAQAIDPEYTKLRQVLAPTARYELHGCGVASETDVMKPGVAAEHPRREDSVPGTFSGRPGGAGLMYLRRVAQVFNVPAVGAINVQSIPGRSWRFEGDTITVFPNGKFQYDSEGTRGWDLESRQKAAREYLNSILKRFLGPADLASIRQSLQELVKLYPETSAAQDAAKRLKNPSLEVLEKSPDGSFIL